MSKLVFSVGAVVLTFANADGPVCGPVQSAEPTEALTFEWRAVNLALQAPYDTIQLHAIPRTASGATARDTNTVHYSTSDFAINVNATGLVTVRLITKNGPARVIASMTQGKRTLADTAFIQVTDKPLPAPLATLSIQPQPGGLTSAQGNINNSDFNMGFNARMPFFAIMRTGNPATDTVCDGQGCRYPLLVHFTSSDPSIAYLDDDGAFHPLRAGRVTFTISTVAYGVRKIDSLPFVVGYNVRTTADLYVGGVRPPVIAVRPSPVYGALNIRPYGVGLHVYITNHTGEQVEVSLPQPARGAHFIGGNGIREVPLANAVDTLSGRAGSAAVVVLDSVGTHVLRYRSLQSGAIRDDTLTVLP